MKTNSRAGRALLIAACAALSLAAHAAPFLVADAPDGADRCAVAGLPASVAPSVAVQAGTPPTCRWDLAGIAPGSYSVTATASNTVWGQTSGPSSPFVFQRPSSTSTPASLRLAP